MKGITPVIAIILLLLMAVAAAGGFYFVYQQFSASGTESGSSQIQALGETSLSQLTIESVAAGKVYVRNVGASTIDGSKLTVYVDNVPVDVNVSTSSILENSRATLKFTSVPACSQPKCEVRVAGTATASRSVEAAKLSCAFDSQCSHGESCSSGVCVISSTQQQDCAWYTGETCGNCVCDEGENGQSCFLDCAPRRVLLFAVDAGGPDVDAFSFDWNGTTYVQGENVSNNSMTAVVMETVFDSEGNALAVGSNNVDDTMQVMWSYNDGSSWTEASNLTDGSMENAYFLHGLDFNSSNEAMLVYIADSDENENIGWATFDGSSWSEPANLTNNLGFTIISPNPAFAFSPYDDGMMLAGSYGSGDDDWLNYSVWDGGWQEQGNIPLDCQGGCYLHEIDLAFNGTHAMGVWIFEYEDTDNQTLQWSTWDNSSWCPIQNATEEIAEYSFMELGKDADGDWLMVVPRREVDFDSPKYPQYYTWSDGWVNNGNLTDADPLGDVIMFENEHGAIALFILPSDPGPGQGSFTYWTGSGWSEIVPIDGNLLTFV